MAAIDLLALQGQLDTVLDELRENDSPEAWNTVRQISQTLANNLRTRGTGVDNHTLLGKSTLPQSLASLISLALHGFPVSPDEYTAPIYEMLRLSANLCLDHDPNRGYILDAGLPQVIVSLLEGYADKTSPSPTLAPLDLSIPHLQIVRTAIGVLLNASLGYDAVKFRLISLETALTIIKLSASIYPAMSWLRISVDETTKEAWYLRSGISNWAWRTVSELKDTKDDPKDESTRQILGPDVLPWITPTLAQFIPPYDVKPSSALVADSSFYTNLVQADFETLEETCTLLESLSLDVEDIRLALARGYCFPAEHSGIPCFKTMIEFIEHGGYPSTWNHASISKEEKERKEKKFNICKGALIKSVVEVAGEEKNGDVLWDDSVEGKPGGEFVYTMAKWIRSHVEEVEKEPNPLHRDDLVICASLSLGNLARREKTSTALISSPVSLAPILASQHFFSPETDIKLKHGILGLLKHIAQSASLSPIIPRALADATIVRRINESGVWDEGADTMAIVVQLNAIGVVKHLCNADGEHAFAVVLPPSDADPDYKTALQRIMALVSRSDSVPIKSEGTRVLVNIVRTLLMKRGGSTFSDNARTPAETEAASAKRGKERQQAIDIILSSTNLNALSWFLARSGKFPILINEAVVAFNLLCAQKGGAPLVLDAIQTPVPESSIVEPTPLSPSGSDASSPTLVNSSAKKPQVAHTALEMITSALRNVDNPAVYPMEIRANICTFLVQLTRNIPIPKRVQVQEVMRPILEKIKERNDEKEELLVGASTKVLDFWRFLAGH